MATHLDPSPEHHYHFVTGRLAEAAVRGIAAQLAAEHGFAYSVGVMPITVAALMTPKWLRRHLDAPPEATHVIVPGYCESGLSELASVAEIPVISGPKDCRDLPQWFGAEPAGVSLEDRSIEIIAEINHVPGLTVSEVVRQAQLLRRDGADRIDVGCEPGERCARIGDYIAALIEEGFTVSIDSFDPWEVAQATRRGASLVLSVNSSNRQAAADWGCEVVAIPDTPEDEKSLDDTVDFLSRQSVPMRLDPILEPVGSGLMRSLMRYAACRERHPQLEVMMGIGNVTELSDVDSAGLNFLLLAICEELGVRSVLTTQVINWARSSVRECDLARRLVHYAVQHRVPPKHLSGDLVMLRDPKLRPFPPAALQSLAESVKDTNYRLFVQDDQIHLIAAGLHLSDDDPFRLFGQLLDQPQSENVDAGHAFYLGFEMAKATIARTLSKQYEQDEALRWGLLTREEDFYRLPRTPRHRRRS